MFEKRLKQTTSYSFTLLCVGCLLHLALEEEEEFFCRIDAAKARAFAAALSRERGESRIVEKADLACDGDAKSPVNENDDDEELDAFRG